MDLLQFFSSLAWPAVALTVALVFRGELSRLLGRVQHLKVPGGEATFGEGVAKAEIGVEAFKDSLSASDPVAAEVLPEPSAPLGPEVEVEDPSGLVLRAWEELSRSIFNLREATAGESRPSSNIGAVLHQLESEGIVNHLFVSTANDLRALRNQVAHAAETPTRGSALAYAEQAREMQRAAEAIAKIRAHGSGGAADA